MLPLGNTVGIGLSTVAPASVLPVTLAEAKARLRVTWAEEDADIAAMLAECASAAESECGRAFVSRTLALYLDGFPRGRDPIRLPMPPAVAVVSIKYSDDSGALVEWDSANYYVAVAGEPARIVPLAAWPTAQSGRPESVVVTWVAGYGAADAVPAAAKAAVLEMLAQRWERRGDESATGIPPVARRLLDSLEYGESY